MTEFTLDNLVGTPHTAIANLILDHYAELGMTDQQLAIFLQIVKFSQLNEKFPSPDQLAKIVRRPIADIYHDLQEMTHQSFISVTTEIHDDHHIDRYSFAPFFQRVTALAEQKTVVQDFKAEQAEQNHLYQEIEVEFGRSLSPIEMETVDNWLHRDHYHLEVIRLALKEAVLSDARSLRYIDRILIDWQRRNIKTAADLQHYRDKFKA